MEDKELAEKVAEKLGLSWYQAGDNSYQIYMKGNMTSQPLFSWPTFGLMVEKAEEMGWKINWVADNISFSKNDGEFLATSQYLTGEKSSDSPIKACCLAFLGIFENETYDFVEHNLAVVQKENSELKQKVEELEEEIKANDKSWMDNWSWRI